jgi:AraC-like DNA-binding protein
VLRDKRIHLGPEKLLLIPPNVFYSGEFEKPVPHFYVWFQTSGSFGKPGREALEVAVQPYLPRIHEAVVSGKKQIFALYTLISEILCDIPETFFDSSETTHKALVIEKALRFINQENGNVCNEMIAAHLHLSLTRLLHLFKAEIGVPPQKYCTQIKMFRAEQMLLAGDSIQSVADACGFADRYHFSKEFKRRHQLPPGKWQRNHLKAADEKQK